MLVFAVEEYLLHKVVKAVRFRIALQIEPTVLEEFILRNPPPEPARAPLP